MAKVVAIIPAYNEQRTIGAVVRSVLPVVDEIIVVDDGSTDRTRQEALHDRVVIVPHAINCGLGAALATGMQVALRRRADIAITFDADGQLFPEDIRLMRSPLEQGTADVVIGSRFIGVSNQIPLLRRFYNRIGNVITGVLFDIWTSDSQSGIRGFNRHALKTIQLKCSRMEVSSEFFVEMKKKNLRWQEVPIRVQYTEYSMSKGQSFTHGIKTFVRLTLRR